MITKQYFIGNQGPFLFKTNDPNASPIRIEVVEKGGAKNVNPGIGNVTIIEETIFTQSFGNIDPNLYSAYRAAHFNAFQQAAP